MRRQVWAAGVAVVLVVAAGAWYRNRASTDLPLLTTVPVTRGDVVQTVSCTGTLNAVTTVDVGSQVSGTISQLLVDFNSIVHTGQVLARLDPALFEAARQQAQANLQKTTADVETARVAVIDTTTKFGRTQKLVAKHLSPQSDLDTADINLREARAALQSSVAAKDEAKAALDQAQVDLVHTVILSPIDGIVVNRLIDVGQTVAAGYEAPSLFSIAADLTRMQVEAVVDESDVGQVRAGETVGFGVDAYPNDEFKGVVTQVRLQPQTVQNVVSYTAIVSVDNSQLLLKPGMTANVRIEVARSPNALRVPAVALRFRPGGDVLKKLGEPESVVKGGPRPTALLLPGMVGQVWVLTQGRLEPRKITIGINDGQFVEVRQGLSEGIPVTTAAILAAGRPAVASKPNASPLNPTPPRYGR